MAYYQSLNKQEKYFGYFMVALLLGIQFFAIGSLALRAIRERSLDSVRFLVGVAGRGEALTEFDHLDY